MTRQDLERARGECTRPLEGRPVSRWRPVMVSLPLDSSTVPSKQTVPPSVPAPGPGRRHGRRSRSSGLVSTTSTGSLVPQLSQRPFIRSMSWGCIPIVARQGVSESVSDEPRWRIILVRCASPPDSVPDRRSTEVSEPDLRERVEEVSESGQQRGHRRLVEIPDPVAQVADLQRTPGRRCFAVDLRGPGLLAQSGAVAVGEVVNVTARSTKARSAAGGRRRPWTTSTSGSSGSAPGRSG